MRGSPRLDGASFFVLQEFTGEAEKNRGDVCQPVSDAGRGGPQSGEAGDTRLGRSFRLLGPSPVIVFIFMFVCFSLLVSNKLTDGTTHVLLNKQLKFICWGRALPTSELLPQALLAAASPSLQPETLASSSARPPSSHA